MSLLWGLLCNMFNFIDLNDFNLNEIQGLLEQAIKIKSNFKMFSKHLNGCILASLFFEPSTRTQFSFQAAMAKLGGQFLGFSNPNVSSISKGESFSDTVKIMGSYADLLVIRHSCDGAARAATFCTDRSIINAGDGIHLHPTQTLADLLTLKQKKQGFSNLVVGVCGDLKFGRPVNSLVRALCQFKGNSFVFISTEELKISSFLKNFIERSHCDYVECNSLEQVISKLDVLYMTRVQRERFKNLDDYNKQKGYFKLTSKLLNLAKSNLLILHPLPRVDEIDCEVDSDCRAAYFLQAENGVYARMALILKLINGEFCKNDNEHDLKFKFEILNRVCSNVNCISRFEPSLPKRFVKKTNFLSCAYCDAKVENNE